MTQDDDLTRNEIQFINAPNPVGWWVMPGSSGGFKTKFAAYTKPNALVRFSMKHVFGWKWEDKHDRQADTGGRAPGGRVLGSGSRDA